MILDTNALSAAAESQSGLIAIISRSSQLSIPVIALGEYRYGIARSRHAAEYLEWLESLVRACRILSVDEETTHHYAAIANELRNAGTPIPTNDLWIAALCRQHALSILSRDRHFDRVTGLHRIEW